jgi:sec-independent protein translocase protein TatA
MFGIGGGELIFIIFIALMLFGSDKIPDVARTMGKAMAQLKNASNEIKTEIQKSADANGVTDNMKELTNTFTKQVEEIKSGIETPQINPVKEIAEDIEQMTGPIKRQL